MPQPQIPSELRARLIDVARSARDRAYAPYSGYQVGAALLTADGEIVAGCNIENAAYPATICAERAAVTTAVSDGMRSFQAVAVVTSDGAWPCGLCRQVLHEFAPDMLVIAADSDGHIVGELTLPELLPHGFNLHVSPHAAP
ncbi:MAG: cytidine deaminase [Aggregatilineales bacterium]